MGSKVLTAAADDLTLEDRQHSMYADDNASAEECVACSSSNSSRRSPASLPCDDHEVFSGPNPRLEKRLFSTGNNPKMRCRTFSGSYYEDRVMQFNGKVFYTAGRPPWYDCSGFQLMEPFVIGICGGSASGKTTVAKRIIKALDIQWVTLLSMDSFYRVLGEEEHAQATNNEYDFDHPDAFDFDLLRNTLARLREGKRVEVPVYNFTTHSREKQWKTLYGASVIIFEGILSFHDPEIRNLMDLMVFVDTDSDIRLARRLRRDILNRGRDVLGVLKQYNTYVKPSFDRFIAVCMPYAHIIIPRGGENAVAIDLIVRHVRTRLHEREGRSRAKLALGIASGRFDTSAASFPPSLRVLKETPQIRGLHTYIRNRATSRNEFIFYSNRLMRLLFEFALGLLPFEEKIVQTPQLTEYIGRQRSARKICGVSVLRAGETMEIALREVLKDCVISKILIQTNPVTMEPELYYLRLPKDIHQYHVLLMDATVATGAAAIMAIRILLDHDVPQENITLLSLLMATTGIHSVAYAFPKVQLVTTAVDKSLSSDYHILPGLGNFGDRYFGTEMIRSNEIDLIVNGDSFAAED